MRTWVLLVSLICLSGCKVWVNIPAQRGDLASHNPNSLTVRAVVRSTMSHVLKQYPPQGQYVLIMPDKTSVKTFSWLENNLKAGMSTTLDVTRQLPVYRVAGVQIRGMDAQVDIVVPSASQPKRLLSCYLKKDLAGWFVKRDYLWNMPLDRALLLARPAQRIDPGINDPLTEPPTQTPPQENNKPVDEPPVTEGNPQDNATKSEDAQFE